MKPGNKPDRFTAKARQEGFPARSVYKLEEIDRRCQLLKPGLRVLDLGAAPGSWTLKAAQRVGPRGRVVALDLNPLRVAVPPHVKAMECDIFATPVATLAALGPFDVVLSDLAPHTSGIKDADAVRSVELVEQVLTVADACLVEGGSLVAKVFQGVGFEALRDEVRKRYRTVRLLKPEASRKESVEIFLVGLGKRGAPVTPEAPGAPGAPDAPPAPPSAPAAT